MKIMTYEVRKDERAELARQAEALDISLEISEDVPAVENAALAAGCRGVSILGQGRIDGPLLDAWMPLLDSNRHMINKESIAKMKDGVILVNCSRGELADIETLVEGIESQKIGALGMDTCEGDEGTVHADHRVDILSNRNWFYLHQFRNVIMTKHMAFYTDVAVASMVDCGIRGIWEMANGIPCETELNR